MSERDPIWKRVLGGVVGVVVAAGMFIAMAWVGRALGWSADTFEAVFVGTLVVCGIAVAHVQRRR